MKQRARIKTHNFDCLIFGKEINTIKSVTVVFFFLIAKNFWYIHNAHTQACVVLHDLVLPVHCMSLCLILVLHSCSLLSPIASAILSSLWLTSACLCV